MRDYFNCFTLDFETTSQKPEEAKVCEVALVGANLEAVFNTLIDPECEIPPETSAVHHITNSDVYGKPLWPIFKESLQNFCAPGDLHDVAGTMCILVAHNAEYEKTVLGDFVPVDWICTYKCALRAWPDAPGFKNEVLRYWLQLGDNRGRNAKQNPHSAFHDCQVTHLILRELTKLYSIDQLIEWSKLPAQLPTVPLGKFYGLTWDKPDLGYLQWLTKQADMREDVKYCAKQEIERRYANATQRSSQTNQ